MIRKLINKLFIEVLETQSLSDVAAKGKEQNFTPFIYFISPVFGGILGLMLARAFVDLMLSNLCQIPPPSNIR